MEGDTVTLQDIFEFETSPDPAKDGGSLNYSGLRPRAPSSSTTTPGSRTG